MNKRKNLGAVVILSLSLSLIFPAGVIFAQWSPPVPSQPLPQQYPPQQTYPPVPQSSPSSPASQYPPQAQQPYPPVGQSPQSPSQFSQGMPGQAINDVFGRFSLSMPQGSIPMSSTYGFGIPQAMVQVNVMAVSQDQMFQMNLQNFPNMMRQMGGNVDAEKPIEVSGRQGRFFGVTMKNPQANASFHAMNVFIPGPNLWIQVMGPEQNTPQIGQVLQSILGGLRF